MPHHAQAFRKYFSISAVITEVVGEKRQQKVKKIPRLFTPVEVPKETLGVTHVSQVRDRQEHNTLTTNKLSTLLIMAIREVQKSISLWTRTRHTDKTS